MPNNQSKVWGIAAIWPYIPIRYIYYAVFEFVSCLIIQLV